MNSLKRAVGTAFVVLALASSSEGAALPAPHVNVNTATVGQLCYLPGVGMTAAYNIVAGRPYQSAADLVRVPGIKSARLAVLAPYVTVTGPTTAATKIPSPKRGKRSSKAAAPVK